MKTMRTLFQKKTWIKGMLGMAAFVLFFTCQVLIGEAAEGKVTAETAKIRAQASTDSEVVGSTTKGKTIDILGAVKDASGTVWYKVSVTGGGYGYIRSDLVETSDKIEVTASSTSSNSGSNTDSQKPAETVPTSIGETAAFISQDSVRIRSGASTSHDTVTSLTKGTAITLIGEAKDSSGNKWYQMTCNKNGKNVEGYVRADLITIGEAPSNNETEVSEGNAEESAGAEGTEAENAEGTDDENVAGTEGAQESEVSEPAEPEHNDYEVVYNEDTYWLYDNTNGTMMSVTNLLDVVNQVNENNSALQSQVKNEKIIIIVLAVIIVILVIVMTVLIFKLKDAYYYEEYEEEIEEEEPEPVIPKKKKKSVAAEDIYEEPAPAKKKKARESISEETERPAERSGKKTRSEAELQAAEERKPVKKPAQRKAQNFLVDDDEFEFEFLNMDDKDL